VKGDGGRFMTPPPSRLEARRRLGPHLIGEADYQREKLRERIGATLLTRSGIGAVRESQLMPDLNRISLTSTSSGWLMHPLSLASTIR
jgi:hypothetical protein